MLGVVLNLVPVRARFPIYVLGTLLLFVAGQADLFSTDHLTGVSDFLGHHG